MEYHNLENINKELEEFILSEFNDRDIKYININETNNKQKNNYIINCVIEAVHKLLIKLPQITKELESKLNVKAYFLKKTGKQLGDKNINLIEIEKVAKSYIKSNSYITTAEGLLNTFGFVASPIELPYKCNV